MDNRERATTRAKKHQTKETNFVGRKFYSGGEKIRNASSHQGENEQQEKNANKQTNKSTCNINFPHKACN